MDSNRRSFFKNLGAGAAGMTIGATALSSTSCTPSGGPAAGSDEQVLHIGNNIAVVDTTYGKVRGYILRDIHYFLGIPYGADTSGANRFMPPQKPETWTEVRPTLWWGNTAPQNMANKYSNQYGAFRDHWNYDDVSEDCLRINVFTPGINDGQKRPVMFWIHGGGFTAGNGIEHDGYNGENLAKLGNVVFCSINHRLGPIGFSNLAGVGGEKYAASGNVGMLDIVAALEWVRDNIANFGGDPGNVTIMGQSGGGRKVCTLTAMPSAKGLFHKAVSLSGVQAQLPDKEVSEKVGEYILREAKLRPGQIDRLQQMPWDEYYAIATRARQAMSKEIGDVSLGGMSGYMPSLDGEIIPHSPAYPEAAPTAADVPMIICSTLNESSPSAFDAELENITMDQVVERLGKGGGRSAGMGDKAKEVVEAFVKVFPNEKPIDIYSIISSMNRRQAAIALADAKVKQPAGAYVAWFGWHPPLFDNRLRAFHCVDICFWFYNTDLMLTHTGGGARPRKLATQMANHLLQFMRTGDPNGEGLMEWPEYTTANGETMILNDVCEVKNDPDRDARKILPSV